MFQNCIQDDVHDIEGVKKKPLACIQHTKRRFKPGESTREQTPRLTPTSDSFSIRPPNQFPDFQLGI
jgi:hypothetical protein